jgi:hypothetical protein
MPQHPPWVFDFIFRDCNSPQWSRDPTRILNFFLRKTLLPFSRYYMFRILCRVIIHVFLSISFFSIPWCFFSFPSTPPGQTKISAVVFPLVQYANVGVSLLSIAMITINRSVDLSCSFLYIYPVRIALNRCVARCGRPLWLHLSLSPCPVLQWRLLHTQTQMCDGNSFHTGLDFSGK